MLSQKSSEPTYQIVKSTVQVFERKIRTRLDLLSIPQSRRNCCVGSVRMIEKNTVYETYEYSTEEAQTAVVQLTAPARGSEGLGPF